MSDASGKKGRGALVRLTLLILGFCPVVFGLLWGVFWLHDHIPKSGYWQAALFFLIALKSLYLTAFVVAIAGTLSLVP